MLQPVFGDIGIEAGIVDDGWEVCLLKFMVDMISASAPGNMGDFRERGML